MEEKNENRKKKKLQNERFEITELFMAKKGKNGWDHCFHGAIYREKDKDGNQIAVCGNIYIPNDGMIWSRDVNQDKYGDNLDSIVELRLDYGLHKDAGVSTEIAEQMFFHN